MNMILCPKSTILNMSGPIVRYANTPKYYTIVSTRKPTVHDAELYYRIQPYSK